MWTCSQCGEEIEDQFDSCWKCAGRPDQIGLPFATKKLGALLLLLKIYTVSAPLSIFGLTYGIGLDWCAATHVMSAACLLSSFLLAGSGIAWTAAKLRTRVDSRFVFAGLGLLWIFIFEFWLPSLAR
jgi:hypothetical protein